MHLSITLTRAETFVLDDSASNAESAEEAIHIRGTIERMRMAHGFRIKVLRQDDNGLHDSEYWKETAMKLNEVVIGGTYLTYVSGVKVAVIVIGKTESCFSNRTQFKVKRADNGKVLDKARAPAALHISPPTFSPKLEY
jgi:hypothetical protein